MPLSESADPAWWKEATVYQVYPASFADHAANGHGTLKGILHRVPYLKELGVDIVWLSPCYESPQADMGYDISNYQKIDPQYGTLQDWDDIRDACHERGMKLVMDLVVNHTSDQHEWFKQSRSSRSNPKRDWYIWHTGKINENGERIPPNNWKSSFGAGSAWEWDEITQEFYLHLFLKEQPDLNWENEEVREAVYGMMKWWLERGTDGFRMDVINYISKAAGFPDAPITVPGRLYQSFGSLSVNRPKVHDFLKEMNRRVISPYDCFCVGECPGTEAPDLFASYSKPANKELQMVFHFHHQGFDRISRSWGRSWNPDWSLSKMKKIFNTWNVEIPKEGGWNSNYIENHDQSRIISRLASDHPSNRSKSAKLCCMFHATLTGTIFVYQGQEIGMVNVPVDWDEREYKDIEAVQNLQGEREYLESQGGVMGKNAIKGVLKSLRMTARDNARTPMQWDDKLNAGFSQATPWMRVHDDFKTWNVKTQMADPNSPWTFWKRMLEIRKHHPAMVYGEFIPLDPESEKNYSYIRYHSETNQRILVVLNFAKGTDGLGEDITFDPVTVGVDMTSAKLLISNGEEKEGSGVQGTMTLSSWEGRVYLL
ncbi:putative hydrolase [Naematelia encephala]|uniref:Putative hydrolase n=1 Tax=Naematelia encephala TaxID=71784 RepID=A0A1Y2BMC7_9TREE|nr:putative hydrolase [Naematelia encephala]